MTRSLTVTWFVPSRRTDNWDRLPASVWIRCLQLIPYLERHAIRSLLNDPTEAADVAVFVRTQDVETQATAQAARRRGTRVVFDLCVNYFDATGLTPSGFGVTAQHVRDCRAMVERADAVTAASPFIAARAREFHPHVTCLPDSVNRRHFSHTKAPALNGGPPVAIWCGYSVKVAELEPVLPMLARRGMPLVIVSDAKPRLSRPFEFVRWRHATAPRDLLRGDVCVAPRAVGDPYNLGHSIFKIGVFLAQGVPALAGPVPSYRDLLGPGTAGRLCESESEWEEVLDRVSIDPSVLTAWSAAAARAMEPYWTEAIAASYSHLFRSLVEARP